MTENADEETATIGGMIDRLGVHPTSIDLNNYFLTGVVILAKVMRKDDGSTELISLVNDDLDFITRTGIMQVGGEQFELLRAMTIQAAWDIREDSDEDDD